MRLEIHLLLLCLSEARGRSPLSCERAAQASSRGPRLSLRSFGLQESSWVGEADYDHLVSAGSQRHIDFCHTESRLPALRRKHDGVPLSRPVPARLATRVGTGIGKSEEDDASNRTKNVGRENAYKRGAIGGSARFCAD